MQGLSRGLASLASAGQLGKHVARLGALTLIIEALHPASPERAPAQLPADLQLAQQLHQCAMVCWTSPGFPLPRWAHGCMLNVYSKRASTLHCGLMGQ